MSNKFVSWVLYKKFWIEKQCLVKHFTFLKNVCYQYLNFVLWTTYCFFMTSWLVLISNFLGMYYFPVTWLVNLVYYVILVTVVTPYYWFFLTPFKLQCFDVLGFIFLCSSEQINKEKENTNKVSNNRTYTLVRNKKCKFSFGRA